MSESTCRVFAGYSVLKGFDLPPPLRDGDFTRFHGISKAFFRRSFFIGISSWIRRLDSDGNHCCSGRGPTGGFRGARALKALEQQNNVRF